MRQGRRLGRIKHALRALQGKCEAGWSPEQVDAVNAEMAEGIIVEIRETLEELGCCHGHDMASTPPLFYREAILCACKNAYDKGRRESNEVSSGGASP